MKLGNDVDEWVRLLRKRFQKSASEAMKTLTSARFTYEDARRHTDPMNYALIITRAAKATQASTYSQLFHIYNDLETEFRRDLILPTEDTTMDAFLKEMETKKEIWWELAARNSRSHNTSYPANRPENNFRPAGQQDSYNYRPDGSDDGGSLPQGGYITDQAGGQPPRQTQYPTTYQFNNPPYQNRAYQNQSNYRQQPPRQQAGTGQQYGRSLPQPVTQNQQYRPADPTQLVTPLQPQGNASGLPPRNQQQYRPQGGYGNNQYQYRPQGGYGNNQYQYQNRQPFGQRQNPPAQQGQRAYYTEDGQENQPEGAFQGDHEGYDSTGGYGDGGYLTPDEELPEEAFHEHAYHGKPFPDAHDHAYHGKSAADDASTAGDSETRAFFTNASERPDISCRRCGEKFASNNKLHYHVRRCKKVFNQFLPGAFRSPKITKIIYSSALADATPKLDFRS